MFEKLGGRGAAANFTLYALLCGFGAYRKYRKIHWSAVRRLVFVCSGNICRSPFAAELARARGLPVASFGIDAIGGRPANDVANEVALQWDIDLSSHVSMNPNDFVSLEGDLLVAMEPRHLFAVQHMARGDAIQVTLAGLWCTPALPYLPDPYATHERCFEFVFRLIDESLVRMQANLAHSR